MLLASLLLTFGGVTVKMPDKIHSAGVNLRLGDVAQVTGEDEALVAKVQDLDLGYMPAPGYSRLLHRGQLKVSLEGAIEGLEVTFMGRPQTRVYPKSQTIQGQRIADVAKAAVEKRFAGRDVDLEMRDTLADLKVPLGRKSLEIKARATNQKSNLSAQGIAVDILIDGELWRTQWTSWSVVTWHDVPVLTMPVSKGNKLTPGMFRVERRRQALHASTTPLQPGQVIEAQAKRDLVPGEPVFAVDVERTKVILKNNLVTVEIIAGTVTARSTGAALADGRIGDSIRVRLESTEKELLGTVVGPNLIQIRLR